MPLPCEAHEMSMRNLPVMKLRVLHSSSRACTTTQAVQIIDVLIVFDHLNLYRPSSCEG